jgi:peptidoglycan/LPS O-acetylase OafA/YrhL
MIIRYRPEIDGLRGISIILVILYHAKVNYFLGGYFGVDVFFVISGYLITKILIEASKNNSLSLLDFYERRIRRIIPALYFLLFFLIIYCYFFQSPYFAKDLSQSIFGSTIFAQNFLLMYEHTDYFNLDTDLKPLFHLWSLAIEEQFYLFFPILFMFFFSFKKQKKFVTFNFVLFISSIFYYIFAPYFHEPSFVFYFTLTRIWEILFGCIIALKVKEKKYSNTITLLGLFLILFSVILVNFSISDHYLRFIVVIGSGLVLVFASSKGDIVSNILTNKFLVFIGLISYSAYLWHVPIYSIYRDIFTYEIPFIDNLIILFITFTIASFSYLTIEKIFRKKYLVSRNLLFLVLPLPFLIFIFFGIFGHLSDGFEKNKILKLNPSKKDFYISFTEESKKIDKYIKDNRKKSIFNENTILVVGDSLAGDIKRALSSQKVNAFRYSLNGTCFYKLVVSGSACDILLKDFLKKAKLSKLVIISSDFTNERSEEGALKIYKFLKGNDIKTKIIGVINFKYLSSTSYKFAKYNFYRDYKKLYFNNIKPSVFLINDYLKLNIKHDFIDKLEQFCDYNKKECNFYDQNLNPFFYDTKHLTVEGYFHLGKLLVKSLNL